MVTFIISYEEELNINLEVDAYKIVHLFPRRPKKTEYFIIETLMLSLCELSWSDGYTLLILYGKCNSMDQITKRILKD